MKLRSRIESRFSLCPWALGAISGLILLPVTSSHASGYQPPSRGIASLETQLNNTYLNDYRPATQESMEVLDSHQVLVLKQQLEDLTRDYEMRQRFGLAAPERTASYTGQVSDFSRNVFRNVQSYQVRQKRQMLQPWFRKLRKTSFFKTVAAPVGVVAGIVEFYFGKNLDFRLGESFRISGNTAINSQTARLLITTPFVEGSFYYIGNAPGARDPLAAPPIDPLARGDERVRIFLTRSLPEWGLSGGISYLSTTNVIGASLTKQLLPHLGCAFDFYQPLNPFNSDVKVSGQTFRLFYGMAF